MNVLEETISSGQAGVPVSEVTYSGTRVAGQSFPRPPQVKHVALKRPQQDNG